MARKRTIIIITGANGFIGGELLAYSLNRSCDIRALVHHMPALKHPSVSYFLHDLRKPVEPHIFSGAEILIHCAFMTHRNPEKNFMYNVKGSEELFHTARRQGVQKIVFLSSFSSGKNASSDYGKQKYAIECMMKTHWDAVIRPGLVLGNGGLFKKIKKRIEHNKPFPLFHGGSQLLQTIGIHDLNKVIWTIIEENISGTFDVAETAPVSYKDFLTALACVLNKKIRFINLPYQMLYATVKFAESIGLALPFSKDNLTGLMHNNIRDVQSSLSRLGIEIQPYVETLKQLELK